MPVHTRRAPVEPPGRRSLLWAVLSAAGVAAVALAATAATALGGQVYPAGALPAGAPAVVRIGDGLQSSYSVAFGSRVTVPVEVVDAAGLAAATVSVSYNPEVVRAVACQRPADSAFDGGICNVEAGPGSACVQRDRRPWRHRNRTACTRLSLRPRAAQAVSTTLALTVAHFANVWGDALPVTTSPGEIAVSAGMPDVLLRVGDALGGEVTVAAGATAPVSVTMVITGAHRVGAATILLEYDPQVVRPVSCTRLATELDGGACNAAFDPVMGLVKFNMLSSGGVTGTLPVYSIGFEAASGAPAGAASGLRLIVEHLADPAGAPLSWHAASGRIVVAAGPANGTWLLVGAPGETGAYTVAQGTVVTAAVWVTGVTNLGAATLALGFDPAIVRAVSCSIETEGAIDGGFCAVGDRTVRASVMSAAGFTGTARLFTVSFTPAPGVSPGAASALSLTVENLATAGAVPLPSRVRHGSIQIGSGGVAVALVRVGDGSNGGSFSLSQAGAITVPIRVEGAAGLGAASVALAYDPAVVLPVSCGLGDAAFDGGACNLLAADGLVRGNVLSAGGFYGSAAILSVTFRSAAGATVGAHGALTLTVHTFDGTAGQALPYEIQNGGVTISSPAGPPQVALGLDPGHWQAAIGQPVTVPVTAAIDAAAVPRGLGAATLLLHYDPAVVVPLSCRLNQNPAANGFDGGACNLHFAPGLVKVNALSVAGVSGATSIADVVFAGQRSGCTAVTLGVEHLADTAANLLTHTATGGTIEVGIGCPTPTATWTATPRPAALPRTPRLPARHPHADPHADARTPRPARLRRPARRRPRRHPPARRRHADADSDIDRHADGNSDIYGHADGHGNADRHADSDADTQHADRARRRRLRHRRARRPARRRRRRHPPARRRPRQRRRHADRHADGDSDIHGHAD